MVVVVKQTPNSNFVRPRSAAAAEGRERVGGDRVHDDQQGGGDAARDGRQLQLLPLRHKRPRVLQVTDLPQDLVVL